MTEKTLADIFTSEYEKINDFKFHDVALNNAIQAVIEAHEARKWQPIESAKNESYIVQTVGGDVTVASRDGRDGSKWIDLLSASYDGGCDVDYERCTPTRYQPLPLPTPPKQGD